MATSPAQPLRRRLRGPDEPLRPRPLRRRAGPQWLRRLARRLMVAYWAVCLAVIGAGVIRMNPEIGERLAAITRDPSMDLPGPFPNCAAAHAAGYYDIPLGSPAYLDRQDGDGDGRACEPVR